MSGWTATGARTGAGEARSLSRERAGGEPMMRAQDSRESLKGIKVLVVEDDPLLLMDVESTLAEAGAEVVGSCECR